MHKKEIQSKDPEAKAKLAILKREITENEKEMIQLMRQEAQLMEKSYYKYRS